MSNTDMQSCINAKLVQYFEQLNGTKADGVYKMVMREVEAIVIRFALDFTDKNKSEAARILGINRGTLNKKIKQYEVK